MNKFDDTQGKESMMRKAVWLSLRSWVWWTSLEVGYSMINTDFKMHSPYLLGVFTIIMAGKVGQTVSEKFKK